MLQLLLGLLIVQKKIKNIRIFSEIINNQKNISLKSGKKTYATDNSQKPMIIQFTPYSHHSIAKSGYEDYDTAEKIFKKNIKEGFGVFGNDKNIDELIQNDQIRKNLIKFFALYSQEEIDSLDAKKILTIDEVKYRNDLVEVRNFFKEYYNSWQQNDRSLNAKIQVPTKQLAFAGKITYEQEKHCKNIVHGYSAACGLVSGAMGEGAALGADTVPLRVLQFAMFSTMATYLKVPPLPSLEYYTKEMFAGATLGVGGAKLITSWLGIGGHAASVVTGTSTATGGGSDIAISGGVRAVNATLSTFITEKMGRGYINRVKNSRMNLKDQTIETTSYLIGRGLLTSDNPLTDMMKVDFKDATSPELIKGALERIPNSSQEIIVTALDLAKEFTNRAGTMFVIGFVADLFSTQEKDPQKIVAHAKAILRQSLINAAVYQLCDTTIENTITKEAAETIKDIQENLEKYPEVYHVVINAEHEFFEKVNIDTLNADAFTRQFKNKTFVHNLSGFCNSWINEISRAIVNKDRVKQAKRIKDVQDKINDENQKRGEIDNQLSPKDKKDVKDAMDELEELFKGQANYYKYEKGFGYGRIAGYKAVKDELVKTFIYPVSSKNIGYGENIPNAILFYGPTGVGKSELARALAEQGKCLMPKFPDDFDTAEELQSELNLLTDKLKKQDKHNVVIIDEFDDFGSNPECAKVFANFIKDCANNNLTLLLTTNEPLTINESILSQTLNIPIGTPTKQDIFDIVKFYLPELEEQVANEITEKIYEKNQNGALSISQIKRLCIKGLRNTNANKDTNLKDNMLNLIRLTPPEISKNDLEKFNNEIKQMQGK